MKRRILRSILTVVFTVTVVSLAVTTAVLYTYFTKIQHDQLGDELTLAAAATEQNGVVYLQSLSTDRYRLTWIASDGTVLYDTHAKAGTMDNHAQREEIREAFATGHGSSRRESSTLTEQTVYEAVKLADGTVLRISAGQATVTALVIGMLPAIVGVFLLAVLLSFLMAGRMAARVIRPLNSLDLEHPLDNQTYEELAPLLGRIHRQHQQIDEQMRELRQKQNEFEQITSHMTEALILLDKQKRVVSINPAAIALFSASADAVGEDLLMVERKQDLHTAIERAFENGHGEWRFEKNTRVYRVVINRIVSGDETAGAVLLAFDVTKQDDAERRRREFSANVSHELKTPLQSIIGSAELIENGVVKQEDMPRFIDRIRSEATRMATLVEDIIRLSQLDEGVELQREDVSLLSLSREIVQSLEEVAAKADIRLSVTGDEGCISGVRRLLAEAIFNLCDNAIKYNVRGGEVAVTVAQTTDTVELSVKDSGIGIPQEHQERVFERFYRVDKSHSKQTGGTGLGLSIVKHAVAYHGGYIAVQSEAGQGTIITVTLPKV